MAQPLRIAAVTAATATVLFGSYAVYFDYQRRHNPEFRRKIRTSPVSPHLASVVVIRNLTLGCRTAAKEG